MADVSRAHARAFHALLDQAFPAEVRVHFGGPEQSDPLTYPYLIVWPPPAARTTVNLSATLAKATSTIQITAVGEAADDVLATLDRAAETLQGVHLSIPGRAVGAIQPVPIAAPVRRQDDAHTANGRPIFQAVAQFTVTSTPTPAAA